MEIFNKVSKIMSEISGIESISLEDELQGDIALNSLQMVTLLVMLEEVFEITLDEADMNPFDFTTVSDVIKLVEKYVGGVTNEKNI